MFGHPVAVTGLAYLSLFSTYQSGVISDSYNLTLPAAKPLHGYAALHRMKYESLSLYCFCRTGDQITLEQKLIPEMVAFKAHQHLSCSTIELCHYS